MVTLISPEITVDANQKSAFTKTIEKFEKVLIKTVPGADFVSDNQAIQVKTVDKNDGLSESISGAEFDLEMNFEESEYFGFESQMASKTKIVVPKSSISSLLD